MAMGKVGIYIQVPFCQTKCTYCNFHTGVVSEGRFAGYAAAVEREVLGYREGVEADTVYVGGGTPSLLEAGLLAGMMRAVRERFGGGWEEATLEADPETIEIEKAREWRAMGFDRISLGTQSFVDEELKAAGRMHRRADIYRALPILREAGFENVSFDLIAGLPKQTRESWKRSLEELIALGPEHVSVYILEVDEGSRLGLEVLREGQKYSAREVPSEELMAEFYETAQRELRGAGYEQYEISNWAKAGRESRHNLKYWRREEYVGFGAGAHSFEAGRRRANRHDAAAYVAAIEAGGSAVESEEEVTREMALEEEIFLGLRKSEGIDLRRIETEYGVDLEAKVERLRAAGMMEREGERVRLAEGKLSVSNEAIVELMRDVA